MVARASIEFRLMAGLAATAAMLEKDVMAHCTRGWVPVLAAQGFAHSRHCSHSDHTAPRLKTALTYFNVFVGYPVE